MRKLNRLTMTLALLLTAVGGAWAQSSLNVVELDVPAEWAKDNSNATAGDLPGFKASTYAEAKTWTGAPAGGMAVLIYAFDGNKICYVLFSNGKAGGESKITFTKKAFFDQKSSGKFYYTVEPTEWSLTPDQTGKTWTLAKMPASNIELQVEYFAESNLFLSKDAQADKGSISVKAGDLGVQFGDDGKSANTVTEGSPMTVTYKGTKKLLGMKVAKKVGNAYLTWDADQKKLVATEIPTTAIKVENSNENVSWQAGTYVVEGNVTITGTIGLSGDVNLIIKDGAKLTVDQIDGSSKNLSIYGQANQTGQLVVDNSDDDAIKDIPTLEVHSAKVTATSSSSECGGFYNIGTFKVYGGLVDAKNTAAGGGYGIYLKTGGSMNIYGGEVKAEGKGNDSRYGGITGESTFNNPITVTVYGGKLWSGNADKRALYSGITLQKGTGFTGKIETSDDNSAWSEYTEAATPGSKYVRVGY